MKTNTLWKQPPSHMSKFSSKSTRMKYSFLLKEISGSMGLIFLTLIRVCCSHERSTGFLFWLQCIFSCCSSFVSKTGSVQDVTDGCCFIAVGNRLSYWVSPAWCVKLSLCNLLPFNVLLLFCALRLSPDTERDVPEKWQQQPTTVCVASGWPTTPR